MLNKFKLQVIMNDETLSFQYNELINNIKRLFEVNKKMDKLQIEIREIQDDFLKKRKLTGATFNQDEYSNITFHLYEEQNGLSNDYDIIWRSILISNKINAAHLYSYLKEEKSFEEIQKEIIEKF